MYVVAMLVEHGLETLDADQVVSLHEAIDDDVVYHLLMPVDEGAALLAGSLGAVGTVPVTPPDPSTIAAVDDALHQRADDELARSAELLRERGVQAHVRVTTADPVKALQALVAEVGADEVIVLTEPHTVQQFFGVDWGSRAARHLDVPTLHLIEHLPFDAQA